MNFSIPNEVNNDILYCQKSLRHYIHVHQMLAVSLNSKNTPNDPRLAELENEILDIGREQKKTVDMLRLLMENYFVCLEKSNLSIDRATANANVANQLFQNFQMCYDKVEPINVKKRLTDKELLERFIYNYPATSGAAAARAINFTDCSQSEKVEVLISPNDVMYQNVTASPTPQKHQVSLLKPKSERLVPHSPKNVSNEQCPASSSTSSSTNLKSRRLNLRQVLKTKAESQILDQEDKNVKKEDESMSIAPIVPVANKTSDTDDVVLVETIPTETVIISHSPTSSSATSLSGDTFDGPDLPDEEEEPTNLGKEAFLRVVGLCTHTYHDYLKTRRSERKRRNCTSTEKRDFHYGKIDILFERQSTRTSKRVFLKSTSEPRPPITKPKQKKSDAGPTSKKPKIESKSNSSSSSSLYDEMKSCISCLKNCSEKTIECESCNVYFHLGCHESGETTSTHSQRIKNRFCPDCLRRQQKAREKNVAQLRDKKITKIISKQRQLKTHREHLVTELSTLDLRLTTEIEIYKTLDIEQKELQNEVKSMLTQINGLTGRSLQLKGLQIKEDSYV